MNQPDSLYLLYKQAFQVYYKPLCQYAVTMVKDAGYCEDIVQEIFLHIWEKKKELIGKDELRFYLFTAVRNRCINHLKKNKKMVISELSGWEEPVAPAAKSGNDKVVDFADVIAEAFDRLPFRCREVFVLSRISRLTYQQIALATGISVKTVENQIGKALKIMRSFAREKQLFMFLLFIYMILYC